MESSGLRPGSVVAVRGRAWTVVDRTPHADCESLRLRGAGEADLDELRTLLTPFDRPRPVLRRTSWRRLRPRRWLHALRRMALDSQPFGALHAAETCRIDLHPYQLEPALAIVRRGATRLLIADAVGLGKTIQAGLILRELTARRDELRALIVIPAGLREQWRDELRGHFDIHAVNADAAWLRGVTRTLPADVNPWGLPGTYIASFDFLKRAEVLRPIEDVTWDLVVVDEAHAAAPATDRRAAVDAVASRARRVVLLTATPHSGDAAQFDALCGIGRAGDDSPLVLFQRSRTDAGRPLRRRTVLLSVRPSPAERRMHRLLERYASRIERESRTRDDTRGTLAAIVLRKRALSSATSLWISASRRLELLSGLPPAAEQQLTLPLGDEDPLDDVQRDGVLAAPGLSDAASERRELAAIVRAARAASRDESKLRVLVRLLRRVREPAIVFTEYRDTLAFIARRLGRAGYTPLLLHGGMTPAERAETQRTFNDRGLLLLATDAASEGLNLHHRCRVVVQYELPWNPMRLQQRTGRVDRVGQTRPVHEILLVAADTAERLVLAPLARRVAAARQATADALALFSSISESRVAAAILAGQTMDDQRPATNHGTANRGAPAVIDLRDEAAHEAARLRVRREWRRLSERARADDGRVWTIRRPRRGGAIANVLLAYRLDIRTANGEVVHAEVIPVRFDGHVAGGEDTARRLDAMGRSSLAERVRLTLEQTAASHASVMSAARLREHAIGGAVPDTARRLVQAGLFERRALRQAENRALSTAALLSEINRRVNELDADACLAASLELRGMWIWGRGMGRRP